MLGYWVWGGWGDSMQLDLMPTHNESVEFTPQFLCAAEADDLFSSLMQMPGWRQDHIHIFGKTHPLPRLHRWFASYNEPYRWSGIQMRTEPFPDVLKSVLQRITHEIGVQFNTALGNLYRDGRDSVSWHADDEPELGPAPVIASLSLGATRRFLMRRKSDHVVARSYELAHGSLLLMRGDTQLFWEHSVPKTTQKVGPRINLTFRVIQ